MGRFLNTPVVIENKAGAGGGIGMGYVAKAKPDGYTLLLALSSISIIPEADKVTGRAPMYQLNQFVPIARFTADPTVLAVRAESPWKTVQEFVADARKRPGAITYGSSGNYGTMHIPMEMFAASADVKLLHVPYTGGGPAVVALLGGNVDAISTGPVDGDPARQGRQGARAGVVGRPAARRAARRPDADGSGIQRDPSSSGRRSFAPAGTPEPVLVKLREAARAAAADPRFVAAMATVETPIQYLDAPELARFWAGRRAEARRSRAGASARSSRRRRLRRRENRKKAPQVALRG